MFVLWLKESKWTYSKKKKGKKGRQEKKNKIKGKVNLFPKRERKKGKKRKTEKTKWTHSRKGGGHTWPGAESQRRKPCQPVLLFIIITMKAQPMDHEDPTAWPHSITWTSLPWSPPRPPTVAKQVSSSHRRCLVPSFSAPRPLEQTKSEMFFLLGQIPQTRVVKILPLSNYPSPLRSIPYFPPGERWSYSL